MEEGLQARLTGLFKRLTRTTYDGKTTVDAASAPTLAALARFSTSLRAKLLNEPAALAEVEAWFRERHGEWSLWPEDDSEAAVVCTNVVSEVAELAVQAAMDLQLSIVEPKALLLAVIGSEPAGQLLDMSDPNNPVLNLANRIAVLSPGAGLPQFEMQTSAAVEHKKTLTEEEDRRVMGVLDESSSGDLIYVTGERLMCSLLVMQKEHVFSEAWDRFEEYLGRWHVIGSLPRISVRTKKGPIAKRIAMDSNGFGVARPEPVAEGALLRMLQSGVGFSAIPISFAEEGNYYHAVFVHVSDDDGVDVIYGIRMTDGEPQRDDTVLPSAESIEQLRLQPRKSALLPSGDRIQIVWLDEAALRNVGGPASLSNAFDRAQNDNAIVPPPSLAFAMPLDSSTVIVMQASGTHVVARQALD